MPQDPTLTINGPYIRQVRAGPVVNLSAVEAREVPRVPPKTSLGTCP